MELSVTGLALAPQLPPAVLATVAAVMAAAAVYGLARRAEGTLWRALAALALLAALLDPQAVREQREPLDDVALVVVDDSGSQQFAGRPEQTAAALASLTRNLDRLQAEGGFAYRVVRLTDHAGGASGTQLLDALRQAALETSADRLAGAILLTDGRAHDEEASDGSEAPPWPLHVLVSGSRARADRSVTLLQAPSFGLVRTGVEMEYIVEDHGGGSGAPVPVELWVDGRLLARDVAETGEASTLSVPLPHAGPVAVEIRAEPLPGEITGRNNRAFATVSGVRDRLRVLLLSQSPHPANRVWRNLLKTDPAVDLIHTTILRTLDQLNHVPERELSLIEFPAQRLFIEEIDSFDLIIADRFQRRELLSDAYFSSIAEYVRDGGALLAALGGPLSASPGLLQENIRAIAPALPTGATRAAAYRVEPTDRGRRHPLTRTMVADLAEAGPWYWLEEVQVIYGDTLLTSSQGWPLLVAGRIGEGRVAVLATDQAWLWARGHGGGGPHGELFRRLAHWLMGEPELEEENLRIEESGGDLLVTRQTLADESDDVEVTAPDGAVTRVPLAEVRPGLWQGRMKLDASGIHRARQDGIEAIGLMGSSDPVEYRDVTASTEVLRTVAEASGGTIRRMEDGVPAVRRGGGGERGWIGLPRREAYAVRGIEIVGLLPAWTALAAAIVALGLAWLAESGRLRFRRAEAG